MTVDAPSTPPVPPVHLGRLELGVAALEQELAQRRVVEGGERPRKAHAGGDVRGVKHELVEGLLDRPSGSHRVEPVRGRGAGRGLALPDLVAIDDQDPGAGARQLACDREPRKARPADQHVAVVLQRCSLEPRLVRRVGIEGESTSSGGADFCHSYAAVSATETTTDAAPNDAAPAPVGRLVRPPDRGRRQARPQLRRHHQAVRGGRGGQRRGGPHRQGRGAGRHRLQVRGGHPLDRALDPPLRGSGRGGLAR